MLNFCDFIQVYVFSTNHHLNMVTPTATSIMIMLAIAFVIFIIHRYKGYNSYWYSYYL